MILLNCKYDSFDKLCMVLKRRFIEIIYLKKNKNI